MMETPSLEHNKHDDRNLRARVVEFAIAVIHSLGFSLIFFAMSGIGGWFLKFNSRNKAVIYVQKELNLPLPSFNPRAFH